MIRGGCERAALAAAAAWLCSAGYCPTSAQAQMPAPAAPTGRREPAVEFDIPAQPMAAALNSWAVQANAQVFVDPGPVAHLVAPAVKGTFTPRQALRALLNHSDLQVAQGANGVFVIKPRPAVAVAERPTTPAQIPDGATAVGAAPAALSARDAEGPWQVGVLAEYSRDGNGASAGLGGEYFITDHLTVALAATAPRRRSFDVPGGPGMPAQRASASLQSSAASLKYYFAPQSRLRPYAGVGLDVTALYGSSGVAGLERVTVGPSVQAGVDFLVSPHWLLNAEVNWEQVPAIRLDPMQFGLGISYRFGAVP